MSFLRFFAPVLALFVLVGAGCLGGASQKSSTGGLWISENTGTAWTAMHALPSASGIGSIGNTDILSFVVDPSDDSAFYAGTKAAGLLTSLDSGKTWHRPEDAEASSGAILDIAIASDDVCTYYLLKASRLLKTTTCGREFSVAYVEGRTKEALTTLAIDGVVPSTLYLGTTAGEVIKSTDAGATWAIVYTVRDKVSALEVSQADHRFVLLGGQRTGLYRSEDFGVTWISLEDSLENLRGADRVYALAQSADGARVIASTKYGLLTSTDRGLTWESLSLVTSSGDVVITALAIDPTDTDTIMYGTESTVYVTVDGGATWAAKDLPSSRAASTLTLLESGAVWLGVQAIED